MGNFRNRISKALKCDRGLTKPKNDGANGVVKGESVVQPSDGGTAEGIHYDCEDCD